MLHIIYSSNKLPEVLKDICRPGVFPEASFPQLSISPWCLKRGTTSSHQPAPHLLSSRRPQPGTRLPYSHSRKTPTPICYLLGCNPPLCVLWAIPRAPCIPRIIFVHVRRRADRTSQKWLLRNLSQFSKSINFLCVAGRSSRSIFKNPWLFNNYDNCNRGN